MRFLDRIDRTVATGTPIHAILDNYSAHTHKAVRAWREKHPRWTFHVTPTSCSRLNAVDGFVARLTRRRLKQSVFRSGRELRDAIQRFIDEHNRTEAKPFVRIADPDDIVAAKKSKVPNVGINPVAQGRHSPQGRETRPHLPRTDPGGRSPHAAALRAALAAAARFRLRPPSGGIA